MKKSLVLLLLLAAAGHAAAQETQDTFELRELVVSAARMPVERSAVAASITVLEAAELRQQGIRNVAEALRAVSGAALVQGGSFGAPTSLFMRGGESDYVQVLIDGVQVNSPGELFDFGNLTLDNIERIEIVRGPSSVLFGSDAVTGLVQLFTRQGARRTRVALNANGGSHESGAFNAELSGGTRRASYALGASFFRSDGTYAFNNQHSNTGVTARASFAPGARSAVTATVRYNANTFHYPTDGAGNLVDANQFHVAHTVVAGIELAHRLTSRLEARAQLGFSRNEDRYDDAPDNAADTTGFYAFYSDERFQREALDMRLNYVARAGSTLTVGAEYEQQRQRGWNLSESEFGPFDGGSREQRSNSAAYTQLLTELGPAHVQMGMRVEDNDRFGGFTTYRGGVSLPLGYGLRVRASGGTGFKEPRFYEQFAQGFVRGNPDLEPETSRSLEGGIEHARGRTSASLTYFAQRFRNMIQYVNQPFDSPDPNYLNLAAARSSGLELEAAHAFGRLGLRSTFTLLDTEVTNQGTGEDPLFAVGEQLIRRPRHTASLTGTYTLPVGLFSATANYVGAREDLDFREFPSSRIELDPYTRLDVAAEVNVSRGLRGTLKLENALAADYQEVFNFPARGRVIFVGLRYTN